MPLDPGQRLGPYEVISELGAGGMGEVYRARHLKLGRDVAIKVLPEAVASDRKGLGRFEREARTASALNHPNIVTIHDIAEEDGTTYIAMELVEGRTLGELLARGALPMAEVLRIGSQVAEGLARAHAAGIIHRDIKPANVMVTADGLVKILDFGLAKPLTREDGDGSATGFTTGSGVMAAGTPHYMAPEQWTGEAVDHRADQFALGVLLYQMATGERPFNGPSVPSIMTAILTDRTPSVRAVRKDVPPALDRIARRCLEKDPGQRFASSDDLAAELRACAASRARPGPGLRSLLRRPAVAAPLAAGLIAVLAGAGFWMSGSEARWAEREAPIEIAALIEQGELYEAFRIGLEATRHVPDHPEIDRLMERITLPVHVSTDPEGAEVWVKGYDTPDAPWERLGVTPLSRRVPYTTMRWRLEKEGYEPIEGAPFSGASIAAYARNLVLDPVGSRPPGTVRVPSGVLGSIRGIPTSEGSPLARLESYFLDRHEVMNRDYQAFVDAGGYQDPRWWPAPMELDGREVAWAEAVAELRDETGRPGPAGWRLGRFPDGEADHPVGGISWFEAAAYCRFAGKSLPTVYHWSFAVGQAQRSDILTQSNIDGDGMAAVGEFAGLAAYGTYDMAGNVKEWVWNATDGPDGLRYILGGAWNEPRYMFLHLVAQDPWGRAATNGVRCAVYPEPPSDELLAPVTPERDHTPVDPVDERTYELLRGVYAYDRSPLESRIEAVDTMADYRWETVSIRTAYGSERMEVHLLIPHDAVPPYHSVVWFPGGDAYSLRSSRVFSSAFLVDFIPRTGRVLVHPAYYGMYERFDGVPGTPNERRDHMIRWAQDLGRTLDYLETRDDLDAEKVAFYGFSNGAVLAPVFTALEPRIATAILVGGGFTPQHPRPEMHPQVFGPRTRTPTLMINGRDDFIMPYEAAQRPFFEMLGAPDEDKRHAVLPGGHIPDRLDIVREVLDWLDQRFGPVRRQTD